MNKRYFLALCAGSAVHVVANDATHARQILIDAAHEFMDDDGVAVPAGDTLSDSFVVWKEIAPHIAAGINVPSGTLDSAEVGAFFVSKF